MVTDTYDVDTIPQSSVSYDNLREMIGLQVRYNGVYCQIVEVIEEDFSLVLADMEYHLGIQADQHGEAHRKVPKTYTINIYNPEKKEFSPSFLMLEPVES